MRHSNSAPLSCIYCDGPGPFNDEHVIPAGLGGDDNRFLLEDMVCEVCNTKRFSPLEREFLRNSPIALARLFEQRRGRKRGAKENNPKLEASDKRIVDKDGRPLEVDFGEHARPEILPQLIRDSEEKLHATGRDQASFFSMLDACRKHFVSSLTCAFKQSSNENEETISAVYEWEGNGYVEKNRTVVTKPRGNYIWISVDEKIDTAPNSKTSFYQRKNGQLVLKIKSTEVAADSLTFFRKAVEQLDVESVQESDIVNPLVSLTGSFSIDVIPRVLAKISFNILAHLVPKEYLSQPNLSEIKRAILTGNPQLPYFPDELTKPYQKILKRHTPDDHHSFLVCSVRTSEGGFTIYVMALLYGHFTQLVILGKSLPHPPIELPVLLLVEYNEHCITLRNARQFLPYYHTLPKWPFSPIVK